MESADLLLALPLLGNPLEDMPDYRELVRPFGAGSFTIRYRLHSDMIVLSLSNIARKKHFIRFDRQFIVV